MRPPRTAVSSNALAAGDKPVSGDGEGSSRGIKTTIGRQPNVFRLLTKNQLAIVLACAERRRIAKGKAVFAQGEPRDSVFIIESGIVRTFYISPAGREFTLMYWQPGNLVGIPEILKEGIYRWSGVAVTPTDVLAFKCKILRSLIVQMPELSLGLIEALEFKSKCSSMVIEMLSTMNVAERLAQALKTIADIHGERTTEGIVLRAPFTHESLATMVGASRQWVTTELHKLEKQSILRIGRGGITIRRPDLL